MIYNNLERRGFTMNRILKTVEELVPMDDTLFHKLIESLEFDEELLQVILRMPLKVKKVSAQKSLRNVKGRSVILDLLCMDENENYFNVEIQKEDNDDHQKRVRYNGSNIDTYVTEKGSKFSELPDVYVIYISRFDVFKKGYTMYHVDRTLRETGELVENGFHEVYVNSAIDDGSEIADLMKIFESSNVIQDKRFPNICQTIQYFKEGKGKTVMCEKVERYAREYAEEYAKEYAKEQSKEHAKNLFSKGATFELVKQCISDLTEEELLAIQSEVK